MFKIKEHNVNFFSEIIAGITTFITLSYILLEYPQILSTSEISAQAAYIAICLACFVGCVIMGMLANKPFALAPSMSIITFFSVTLVGSMGYTIYQALALSTLAGLLFLILALTGLCDAITNALSASLKGAISAGIGLYIALLGIKSAGILVSNSDGSWTVRNFAQWGDQRFLVVILLLGILIIALLEVANIHSSIIGGIIVSAIVYAVIRTTSGKVSMSALLASFNPQATAFSEWFSGAAFKNLSTGFKELFGNFNVSLESILAFLCLIVVCSLSNSVESSGTLVLFEGEKKEGEDAKKVSRLRNPFLANSLSSSIGTCLGCPALSVAPESNAGILAGGKTGLTAVTTGVMFFAAIFFSSAVESIPTVVTSAAMVYAGFKMMSGIKNINLGNLSDGLSALFMIIIIPLTSSIIDGIALGLIAHVVISLLTLKFKEISVLEVVICAVFALKMFFPFARFIG